LQTFCLTQKKTDNSLHLEIRHHTEPPLGVKNWGREKGKKDQVAKGGLAHIIRGKEAGMQITFLSAL
jgi:hypothetical protein